MKIAVLTSGGDAPGMNAFLYNLYKKFKGNLFAVPEGFSGLIKANFVPLESFMPKKFAKTAGTVIKSSRCPEFMTDKGFKKAVKNVKDAGFDYVIVCGGNGSLKGARALSEAGINVLFVPGTVDNDLSYTEYSLGFSTACFHAVNTIFNSMPSFEAFDRACVFEVMGRDNDDIAIEVAKLCQADILITNQKDLNVNSIAKVIKEKRAKGESSLIVLRENLASLRGLTKELNTVLKDDIVRYAVIGYVQRGGFPISDDLRFAKILAKECAKNIKLGIKNQAIGVKNSILYNLPLLES